ncbi:MAG TPA: hypothetical protein PK820_08450 [Candidatus Competibacteraceae bacterium]|nr:hypothetical protein [Candidatus Competibacteraceae bacterium]
MRDEYDFSGATVAQDVPEHPRQRCRGVTAHAYSRKRRPTHLIGKQDPHQAKA